MSSFIRIKIYNNRAITNRDIQFLVIIQLFIEKKRDKYSLKKKAFTKVDILMIQD